MTVSSLLSVILFRGGYIEVDLEGKTFGSYWEGQKYVHNFIPCVQLELIVSQQEPRFGWIITVLNMACCLYAEKFCS